MRPSDLYELRSVGEVVLLPEGDVAFTVTWPDQATDQNRSTISVLQKDGTVRQLTDGHLDRGISLSPDGQRLAFLRTEPGARPRPFVVELANGATQLVDGLEDGADSVSWLGNNQLVLLAPQRPADQVGVDNEELARRPRIIHGLDYRYNGRGWTHDRQRQVVVVDLATATQRVLSDQSVDHRGLATSPNGDAILAIGQLGQDNDLTATSDVLLFDLESGKEPVVLTQAGGRWAQTGWTADGRPMVIGTPDGAAVRLMRPHLLDRNGVEPPRVLGLADVSAASVVGAPSVPCVVDAAVLLPGTRGGAVTIDRYELSTGNVSTLLQGQLSVGAFDATADGTRIVAAVSTPTRPAELWQIVDNEPSTLLSLNEELLAQLDLVEPEQLQIPSTDGVSVEAFLFRPPPSVEPATSPSQPGPALHYIHGGPMFAYGYEFFDEFQLAAAAGYIVIAGNPRGSDGYGEEWAACLTARLGTIDWQDITAISDHLFALPEVDSERVGVGGGSYGGFMTAWAISHSDRYRAALVERAVTNWESFVGTSDIGAFFGPMLVGASILGDGEAGVDALRRQSPLTYASEVRTPTLILHSEEDWRCPIEQAEQLFAAYRHNGVDVTFVRFPGENHELTRSGSPQHRVERFEIVHDFFGEHLGVHSNTPEN